MDTKGRKLFRYIAGIMTAVVLMGSAYATTAMASGIGLIDTGDLLDIHAEASDSSEVVGQVMDEGHVAILGRADGWVQIQAGDIVGWVPEANLIETEVSNEEAVEANQEIIEELAEDMEEALNAESVQEADFEELQEVQTEEGQTEEGLPEEQIEGQTEEEQPEGQIEGLTEENGAEAAAWDENGNSAEEALTESDSQSAEDVAEQFSREQEKAQRILEEQNRAFAEAQKLAEEQARAFEEAQKLAEEQARALAEAQKKAEEQAKAEALAQQQAQEQAKAAALAQQQAQEQAKAAALAQQLAQEQVEAVGQETLKSAGVSAEELELLASIIYCEAKGEPYIGKVAVGNVVMNRVKSSKYPNTIKDVIYAKGQFSPVRNGSMAKALRNDSADASCYQAALEALSGSSPVGDKLYFRRVNGRSGQVIGHHVFY